MPFKSKAQQRFMFAKHPKMAKEFADATPDIKKLPEHLAEGGEVKPMNPIKGDWEKIKALMQMQSEMNQKQGLKPVGQTDPYVLGLPGVPMLPGMEQHMSDGGEVRNEPGLEDATVSDFLIPALMGGIGSKAMPMLKGLGEAGEVTLGRMAPKMEEAGEDAVTAFVKGIQKNSNGADIKIYGVKGPADKLKALFGDEAPGSVPEHVLRAKGILPEVKTINQNAPNSYAHGGEVDNRTFLEKLADKLHGTTLSSDADEAEKALHVDDPQTSTDTVKGYADGGDVQPDYMQGAAQQAAMPLTMQPWMMPQPDQQFMGQLNAGTAIPPPPQPNAIMGASQKMQSLPSTPPNIYNGMTAEDRNALMQQLIARKSSPGMLVAKGAAGLGDAITSAFGKSPTQAMQGIRENESKDSEQRIGAMDTERQQKLQDLEAQQTQGLNDPNSTLSQSMRKTLKSAGLNVPSGMSGAIMLKIAGPLGELAMKQATLDETGMYHKGELANAEANRKTKIEEYASEHPILNMLNPVGGESTPQAGHGVPELGSTFNGQKITGVRRIK